MKAQTDNIVNKRDLFLGPSLYKKLKGKARQQQFNAQNNDNFSLAMVLLNLGTNDSVQDVYLPNGEINKKKLEEHMQVFAQRHGSNPQLVNKVQQSLSQDDLTRDFANKNLSSNLINVNSTPPIQNNNYGNDDLNYDNQFSNQQNFVQGGFNGA